MRLHKYLAQQGIASRRRAEEMIRKGEVSVNGEKITSMGYIVQEGDDIRVDGKRVLEEKPPRRTYVFYKPKGVISSTKDRRGRTTVSDYFQGMGHLYPIGRLDYLSEGLLLVTNDGDLALRLTHPRYAHTKLYEVRTSRALTSQEIQVLEEGVWIDGYKTRPVNIERVGKNIYHITLHEGRNRQIRKMMELFEIRVENLLRLEVGGITLKNLKPGQWRELTREEKERLI